MNEVTLAGLLPTAPRGRWQSKVPPSQAREEVSQVLRQLQRDVEQAGASPAQVSALACLQRSFLGVFAALSAPWLEEVGTKTVKVKLGSFDVSSATIPAYEARVAVRADLLFDQLRAAVEALDDLLARLAAPPSPEPKSWAEDDRLLEQLQPLFSALATRNGDAALAELGLLAGRLRAQGIEMMLADDATADCFTLYDGDADSYVTVTPAIAVRGELRVRGEARRPRDGRPPGDVVAGPPGDVVAGAEGSAGQEEKLR